MTKWEKILEDHPRVILVGRSNVGKTRLASQVTDRPVFTTDYRRFGGTCPDDMHFKEVAYHFLAILMADPGPFILEGVQAIRVIRAGLRDHQWEPDACVHLLGLYEPDDLPPDQLPDDPEDADRVRRSKVARAKGYGTTWNSYFDLRDEREAKAILYEVTEADLEEEA